MELAVLVEKAQAGDVAAFTTLVGRFQHLAFAYALAAVRDFTIAEEVAQEAFVAAWVSLARLRTPAAFPGWLRGIVGHCAHRVLRRRVLTMVPLDDAAAVPSATPGPPDEAERRERLATVIATIEALPPALREVTLLHYMEELSHAEIAVFLGITPSAVNNRLHAARVQLKRRMVAMMKETLREHRLPDDFPTRVGRIVATTGPVVEARFDPADLPEVYTSLSPAGGHAPDVHVIQRLPDGRVVGIAVSGESMGVAGQRVVAGGTLAIVGDARVGTTVVVEELTVRLRDRSPGLTIFTFLAPETAQLASWPAVRAEGYSGGTAGSVQTFHFLRERPAPGAAVLDDLDAVIVLSPAMAAAKIYPCIDPLASRSRLLDPTIVGDEHIALAARAREALTSAVRLEGRDPAGWSEDERRLVIRVRCLRQFFGQPFFIAEPYTHRPGSHVARAATVRDGAAILDGVYDAVPVEAFRFKGGIEEVLAAAAAAR